jgi:ribonuclease HII
LAILAGIDEAGLGPVLGPLVVTSSLFRLPDEMLNLSLWRVLSGAVTQRNFRRSPALPIADSKQMAVRTEGVIHLERGVLGMMHALGRPAGSLRELLRAIAPQTLSAVGKYPWYAPCDLPLPRQADGPDLTLRARCAAAAMARHGITPLDIQCEPVLEADYNRLVGSTRNKSVALFGVVSKLIAQACSDRHGQERVKVVVDHQGGRIHYLPNLQQMFEGGRFKIVQESETASVYEIVTHAGRSIEIAFLVGAEDQSLPVALASMTCKYVRELFMEMLNAWWANLVPDLKPTAGYHTDGHRFLRDIAPMLAQQKIERNLLVRCW